MLARRSLKDCNLSDARELTSLENGQISAHYEFRHSLYREFCIGGSRKPLARNCTCCWRRGFKAFLRSLRQELATELALHFEGGHDYEQAIRYLILAAQNAVGRFAYRDCVEILHHAHELVLKLTPSLRAEIEVRILESMAMLISRWAPWRSPPRPTRRRRHERSKLA